MLHPTSDTLCSGNEYVKADARTWRLPLFRISSRISLSFKCPSAFRAYLYSMCKT